MSEYKDAHKVDEDGVSWVKVGFANKFFNGVKELEPEIRTALGPYNDDAEPVALLVGGLVEKCERLERLAAPLMILDPADPKEDREV